MASGLTRGVAVQAAGGVLWRRQGSTAEVAIVHRPRYDDWSLPKGKLDPGEPELVAAVREVAEETGASADVSRQICTVKYLTSEGTKRVTYWAMRYRGGEFTPNSEVDELQWLPIDKARKRLSYDIDRSVLDDFTAVPVPDAVIVLVRHAKAGKRSEWRGRDALRPLDENGQRQADALRELLACFGPKHVYSADRTRCIETVAPLAEALDLQVHVESVFSDDSFATAPMATQTAVLALAKPDAVSVVCSQGLTIPSLIDRLGPGVRSSDTRKGAWWVLTLTDGDVVTADYYSPP